MLIRYNFRIVMFNNWWLLVFPIAVSQFTVFWNIITRKFTPALPATAAELITPLLAAFLGAHVLAPEYHARVGAILASKPLKMSKLVMLRLIGVLGLVFALELLSLAAYYFGMAPYDLFSTFMASVPSTLFLTFLAITFATLFRHPLAGFAVAALYWALHLPNGPPVNPFFSLTSYSTSLTEIVLASSTLLSPYWIAKGLMVLAAVALYLIHSRLVFRLGVAMTRRARIRGLAWAGAFLSIFLISGAGTKVIYGYSHRGSLIPNDPTWFRQQFAVFGPIPVTYLFGPAFTRYIGETPGAWKMATEGDFDLLGDSLKHRRELKEVVDHMPKSMWAPSAADLMGRLEGRRQNNTIDRVAVYQHVVDAYPDSPYVDYAVREKAISFDEGGRVDEARKSYEELLKLVPQTIYRTEAYRYIVQNDRKHNNLPSAEEWAHKWVAAAKVQERFLAYAEMAEISRDRGNIPAAKEAAQQAIKAASSFRRQLLAGQIEGNAPQQQKWDRDARDSEDRARRILGG